MPQERIDARERALEVAIAPWRQRRENALTVLFRAGWVGGGNEDDLAGRCRAAWTVWTAAKART